MPERDLTAVEWDDDALDRLSTVSPEDGEEAAALWRESVRGPLRYLLDADAATDDDRDPEPPPDAAQ